MFLEIHFYPSTSDIKNNCAGDISFHPSFFPFQFKQYSSRPGSPHCIQLFYCCIQ